MLSGKTELKAKARRLLPLPPEGKIKILRNNNFLSFVRVESTTVALLPHPYIPAPRRSEHLSSILFINLLVCKVALIYYII